VKRHLNVLNGTMYIHSVAYLLGVGFAGFAVIPDRSSHTLCSTTAFVK